jgi:UDP-N-acetylmuramoylalanine--D-glutamate ligase
MIDSSWFWEGKRVTVVGLGLLGRGMGDVAYVASQGAEEMVVTDMKSAKELEESLAALKPIVDKYKNVRFVLGGHREENFVDVDIVIQAAGVPKHSLYTELAREHGIPVHMSTALAAKWCMESDVRVVGVTGTRGKSTVSQMIYDVLKRNGVSVHLGGNIRGVSTLQLLNDIAPGDTLVMELDSWQLQGFGELTISPNISVFTNLMPDHMNYYKSMDEYFEDKAQIFAWQKEGDSDSEYGTNKSDVLICGAGIAEKIIAHAPPVAPIVPNSKKRALKLIGEHNQENAALAAAALRACGLGESEIERGLSECEPVEGRLQYVKDVHGIKIYNDNNASTPEATLAAIASVKAEGPITLVWGGSDKGTDMQALIAAIQHDVIRVIFLPGTGSEKVLPQFVDSYLSKNMPDAVQKAIEVTPVGGVLLFSPAFASFGLFKNYYDRNDQFLGQIAKL